MFVNVFSPSSAELLQHYWLNSRNGITNTILRQHNIILYIFISYAPPLKAIGGGIAELFLYYTTDESWAYGPKEGVEAFESITFFIRFIYAINFEHLFIKKLLLPFFFIPAASCLCFFFTTFAVMAFPNRRMLTKPTGVFNRWTILEE